MRSHFLVPARTWAMFLPDFDDACCAISPNFDQALPANPLNRQGAGMVLHMHWLQWEGSR